MARQFNPFVEGGKLTAQQTEVARRMAMGASTGEVAREMGLSSKTVEYHRAEIYNRLGVSNPVELTHWALAVGLVENRFEAQKISSGTEVVHTRRPDWTRVYGSRGAPVIGIPRVAHGIERGGDAL